MSETRRQRRRRQFADRLEDSFGPNVSSKELRAINRRIEKEKRAQFKKQSK